MYRCGLVVNALHATNPWFDSTRRHKPSLRGSQTSVLLVLVGSLDKWGLHPVENLCQIKYVDLSAVVTTWEVKAQLKAPFIKLK